VISLCPHSARTNTRPIPRGPQIILGVPGTPDLQVRDFAIVPEPARHGRKNSANAVWVHAHPGFKSPSLRH
jgi:hypothetical protein